MYIYKRQSIAIEENPEVYTGLHKNFILREGSAGGMTAVVINWFMCQILPLSTKLYIS